MRDGYKIVDTDCHQMENQAVWSDYIDAPFKGREPKPGEYKGKKYFCVEGEPVQPPEEEGHYPMHAPELLAAICRAYNDWSREYCAKYPKRLCWAAMLPLQATDLAIAEANRFNVPS